uniref:Uncharacterized protein n=1 Tax=Rhizophora mucronata TaxID=61149 RepID=A0A2P2NIQ8_RHIMU
MATCCGTTIWSDATWHLLMSSAENMGYNCILYLKGHDTAELLLVIKNMWK